MVAVEPGTQVVILVGGEKEPRKLSWAEVSDVAKGKYVDEKEPKAADAEGDEEEEEAVEPRPGRVKLRIQSSEPG